MREANALLSWNLSLSSRRLVDHNPCGMCPLVLLVCWQGHSNLSIHPQLALIVFRSSPNITRAYQENMMPSAHDPASLLVLLGILTLSYFAARRMFGSSHDPREPPLAPQSIPILGHLIGLSRLKFNYYVDLRYLKALLKPLLYEVQID